MVPEEARSNNKRQKDEHTIYCLPSDIIERVFLTLPFRTLLRCARVCKQWRNFIHDPEFVASQLQHAPQYALLFSPQETVSRQRCPSDAILVDEALSQSTCGVPVIGPDEFLFGSCNGLLALYTKTSTIKIANFSTGQCLHLEKPVKNLRGDHFSLYTFGFHPATKQYKITHFLRDCTQTGQPHNDNVSVIQVYTLGDEKWKDIPTPIALNLNSVRNSGVVNNDGTLYWLTEDMIANCRHAIMSFDMSEEFFARIQLPEVLQDCAHGYPRRYWIREIDGLEAANPRGPRGGQADLGQPIAAASPDGVPPGRAGFRVYKRARRTVLRIALPASLPRRMLPRIALGVEGTR
ncbi:hypothetical protein QYE76_005988 [Lolium multiflorum]|uniref:F-box domain-containing protein n=1 Tax=Lolium multiflorum TaxID=4521 RepID=A0AAD8RV11_LOLMU|nr:hypothetical protein QYE76_005988 [Lolium multiflorum]